MRSRSLLFLAATVANVQGTSVSTLSGPPLDVDDVRDPRLHGGRVTDHANIIDAQSWTAMKAEILHIERDVAGSQVIVVTVDAVKGSPKRFATALFNHWRIGSREHNNGVLVLVVRSARRVEIEIGRGLKQAMGASWCSSMLVEYVVPHFKRERYGIGLLAGLQQIGLRLRRKSRAVAGWNSPHDVQLQRRMDPEDVVAAATWGAIGSTLVGNFLYGMHADRMKRHCHACKCVVKRPQIGAWTVTRPATHLWAGEKQRGYTCQACGHTASFVQSIRQYDGVHYRSDGTPDYYYRQESDSNSGGSSSGGGGGASW